MARKIVFEKLTSKHSDIERAWRGIYRTRYEGIMTIGPSVGKSFRFLFDSTGGGIMLEFCTSPVKTMMFDGNKITLSTKNSSYLLTVGEEIESQ